MFDLNEKFKKFDEKYGNNEETLKTMKEELERSIEDDMRNGELMLYKEIFKTDVKCYKESKMNPKRKMNFAKKFVKTSYIIPPTKLSYDTESPYDVATDKSLLAEKSLDEPFEEIKPVYHWVNMRRFIATGNAGTGKSSFVDLLNKVIYKKTQENDAVKKAVELLPCAVITEIPEVEIKFEKNIRPTENEILNELFANIYNQEKQMNFENLLITGNTGKGKTSFVDSLKKAMFRATRKNAINKNAVALKRYKVVFDNDTRLTFFKEFDVNNGTLVKYRSEKDEILDFDTLAVNVPDVYNNEIITAIGKNAFSSCSHITKIVLSSKVVIIDDNAFEHCRKLKTISIPDSVESIGESAFENCVSLSGITIPSKITKISKSTFSYCSQLEEIKLPYRVESIGDFAFEWCVSLSNISFPNSVKLIGRKAFLHCEKLEKIVLPESLIYIGDSAFEGCVNLTEITIPKGVTSIGENVFYICDKLKYIYGSLGSVAEKYAKKNNIQFVDISSGENTAKLYYENHV